MDRFLKLLDSFHVLIWMDPTEILRKGSSIQKINVYHIQDRLVRIF